MRFGVEDGRERSVAVAGRSGTLEHNVMEEDFWRSRLCGTQGLMESGIDVIALWYCWRLRVGIMFGNARMAMLLEQANVS